MAEHRRSKSYQPGRQRGERRQRDRRARQCHRFLRPGGAGIPRSRSQGISTAPSGILLGRAAWSAVARQLGVFDEPVAFFR